MKIKEVLLGNYEALIIQVMESDSEERFNFTKKDVKFATTATINLLPT